MRRTATFVAAGLVAVTSTSAVAAPGHATSRAVVTTYTAATSAFTSDANVQGTALEVQGLTSRPQEYGFAELALRRTDRTVALSLQDRTGHVVAAVVSQTTRSGQFVQLATFCGRTPHPLRLVAGGGELVVRPAYALCGSTPSVPTTGTVRAVLTST